MRIVSLEVEYPESGWKLEKMTFDNLNLLVGVSGVGKTRILNALLAIKGIALGNKIETDIAWKIEFSIKQDEVILWEGKTLERDHYEEHLKRAGRSIFDRSIADTTISGAAVPNLSRDFSLLKLFSENPEIKDIVNGFQRIIETAGETSLDQDVVRKNDLLSMPEDSSGPRRSDLIRLKLFQLGQQERTSSLCRTLSNIAIVEEFKAIFPTVTDVRLSQIELENDRIRLELTMLEQGQEIPYRDWSSGMKVTFNLFTLIFSAPIGSIFLIDEFENSLGVNCIHAVTDSIMQAKREHQFIITSHHPYIINNVPFRYWKIITRKGSVVSAHDAEEFRLGKSKHEAFFQLANLPEFTNGILQR